MEIHKIYLYIYIYISLLNLYVHFLNLVLVIIQCTSVLSHLELLGNSLLIIRSYSDISMR